MIAPLRAILARGPWTIAAMGLALLALPFFLVGLVRGWPERPRFLERRPCSSVQLLEVLPQTQQASPPTDEPKVPSEELPLSWSGSFGGGHLKPPWKSTMVLGPFTLRHRVISDGCGYGMFGESDTILSAEPACRGGTLRLPREDGWCPEPTRRAIRPESEPGIFTISWDDYHFQHAIRVKLVSSRAVWTQDGAAQWNRLPFPSVVWTLAAGLLAGCGWARRRNETPVGAPGVTTYRDPALGRRAIVARYLELIVRATRGITLVAVVLLVVADIALITIAIG
jgi:hypothetical protein